MLKFLILVILVSIAFGISLQSAFWGCLIFMVGALVCIFVFSFLGLNYDIIRDAFKTKSKNNPPIKEAKIVNKSEDTKKTVKEIFSYLLLIVVIFSPIYLMWLINTLIKDCPNCSNWLYVLAFIPITILIIWFIINVVKVVLAAPYQKGTPKK